MFAARRSLLLALTATFLFAPFFLGYHFTTLKDASLQYIHQDSHTQNFDLIVPATGPNLNFCRLLLSAAVTGWPEPILVGWNGRGIFNGSESLLFRITETLSYLRTLPPSADNDLMLIVDGYNVWMQLGPEVMISRYSTVLRKNNDRLKGEGLLHKHHAGAEIHHSIVFSSDKVHYPHDEKDAAAWAVPESSLPQNAFGPETDKNRFTMRPRWLNSGTIMGPVKDLRDLFHATFDTMDRKYHISNEYRASDQYYLAEVFAAQEVNRRRLREGNSFDEPFKRSTEVRKLPDIPAGRRTEYHICLDYEGEMFQTAAGYDQHLTWMRYNQSTTPSTSASQIPLDHLHSTRIDQWLLSPDISTSPPPYFPSTTPKNSKDELPTKATWEEQSLGTNTITHHIFPLFHITGDKAFRDRWWAKAWFHPHGENLLGAMKKRQRGFLIPIGSEEMPPTSYDFAKIGGVTWRGAIPSAGREKIERAVYDEKGVAWLDDGEYWGWNRLCRPFEWKVNRDELYVPVDRHRREWREEVVKEYMPPT